MDDTEIVLTLLGNIQTDLAEIREDFANCDFSRAAEFNERYYEARLHLKDVIRSRGSPPKFATELNALLLSVIELEIKADSVRSTSMQLALAEGRTSSCDAGDENPADAAAARARQAFVDLWNRFAPDYGVGLWGRDDF